MAQPVNFDEAIVRFYNGEELAIVHKTTDKRFNVNVTIKAARRVYTADNKNVVLE
ncbi:hypothetical protein LWS67_00430 [Bacillus atrophaeus]|nr:hypothetical protein [Bacillus atrophaeus]MCG8395109.1 hypothetical protein [Bacillus atrophaeus]